MKLFSNAFSSFLLSGLLASIIVTPQLVAAEETADDNAAHLFGDWGGVRSSLAEKGITVESILTNDLIANVSGGLNRSAVLLGNYDLTGSLDTEKAGLWSGGTLFAYVLGDYGDSPSKSVGDLQVTDNIEAYSTAKLYEFFYDQSMFNKKLSLLVGLHDYNSEFCSLEYAGGLINSSFGIGNQIAQVGPSIFNTTSLAVRAKVQPTEGSYLLSALYDGVPGDPNNQKGTRIRFDNGDGLFWGTEVGLQRAEGDESSRYYKAGVGFWYHTKDFEDFNGEPRDTNHGLYFLGEAMVLPEDGQVEQGLGIFAEYGTADPSVNQVGSSIRAGLSYLGLFAGRDDDSLSLGYARAENGNDFMESNPDSHRAETALELSYTAQVLPYLSVQPDLQYIINPSMDRSIDNALVLGLRVGLAM